jgi:hypothetical protein
MLSAFEPSINSLFFPDDLLILMAIFVLEAIVNVGTSELIDSLQEFEGTQN